MKIDNRKWKYNKHKKGYTQYKVGWAKKKKKVYPNEIKLERDVLS